MSTDWMRDLHDMHKHFDFHRHMGKMDRTKLRKYLKFRIDFLQEELDEMKTAMDADDWKSAEETVDALIDLCVVAIGTLDVFNIDGQKAWDTVLMANMNKKAGIKPNRPNPLGLPDLMKPPDWKPPCHHDNLGRLKEIFDK